MQINEGITLRRIFQSILIHPSTQLTLIHCLSHELQLSLVERRLIKVIMKCRNLSDKPYLQGQRVFVPN